MSSFRRWPAASLLVAILAACEPCARQDAPSPPSGKLDGPTGSCTAEDGEGHFCGGKSDGACWCDDSCRLWGNCCADKVTTCDGVSPVAAPVGKLRVATYNLEDVRTEALRDPDDERLRALAATIQALRPDVILLNEVAYDQAGAPGHVEGEPEGQNAACLVDNFLAVAQREGLRPVDYVALMLPTNTGLLSGHDLDNDGQIATSETVDARARGGDAWGYGEFPGQFGFAILVRPYLTIEHQQIRTFQQLRWSSQPGAIAPVDPDSGEPWYDQQEWAALRLSSKNHADVPVRLPTGELVHLLVSHPTPPAFDGPEERNHARNHDEIRLWADYLAGESYVVDDAGSAGGLADGEHFVIMGDLNADPDDGDSIDDPIGTYLLSNPRIAGSFVPQAPDGSVRTSQFGLRIDYVLPSATMAIKAGGVVHPLWEEAAEATDHFPVWLDLDIVPTIPDDPPPAPDDIDP